MGHSPGCRAGLNAVNRLAEDPQTVLVTRIFLMGAALPKGDCKAPGSWPNRVRSLFDALHGGGIAESRDMVLHSRVEDRVLKKWSPSGERLARLLGLKPIGPYTAVGLTGGLGDRWSGEADSRGLDQDAYPSDPLALWHSTAFFGPLVDQRVMERYEGDRPLDEQFPDERRPESVPPLR